MANLPPALDFAKTEEEICEKWAKENTFKTQDALSLERGDEVRIIMYSCIAVVCLFAVYLIILCGIYIATKIVLTVCSVMFK